ncbi:hypothetical protein HK096_000635 [Nowakowskiella sp. JEL0078]|nr:hypothetical protein HK096_000635 [Nowakowskiella sp. JEL0078]
MDTTFITAVVVALSVYFWLRVFPSAEASNNLASSVPGTSSELALKKLKKQKKKKPKSLSVHSSSFTTNLNDSDTGTVNTASDAAVERDSSAGVKPVNFSELSQNTSFLLDQQSNSFSKDQFDVVVKKSTSKKNRRRNDNPNAILSQTEFPPLQSSKNILDIKPTSKGKNSDSDGSFLPEIDEYDDGVKRGRILAMKENKPALADSENENDFVDDGWQVVEVAKPSKTLRIVGNTISSQKQQSSGKSQTSSSTDAISKKQRENQRKIEKQKTMKLAQEQEQQIRLHQHRLTRERATLEELALQKRTQQIQQNLNRNTNPKAVASSSGSVAIGRKIEKPSSNTFVPLNSDDVGDLWG